MSLQQELMNELIGTATYKVEVDREATINGLPATAVTVHAADGREPHMFGFAKANKMDAAQMGTVIRSYLRNRT